MTAPYYGGASYHPQVIQTQGAGGALAGGLDTVLGAILQKQQLDQQSQMVQASLAQKQAETEQAMALAKNTGAETDLHKQELKKNEQAMQEHDEDKAHQTAALGWLMGNSDVANDPIAFGKRMQQGVMNKSVTPEMFPYLLSARDKSLDFGKSLAEMQNKQAGTATDLAKLPFVGPQAQADVTAKNAQATQARAGAAKDYSEIGVAKQKQDDANLQKYLLSARAGNKSDDNMSAVPTAMAQYVADQKRKNPKWTPPADLTTQFLSAAQSPITGLKPADMRAAVTRYDKALKDAGDLKARGTAMNAAASSLRSGLTNPAAYGSSISKFVQAVDQDKNLRYQLLKYYEGNIDPQAPMLLSKFIDKNFQGKLPPQVAQDMFQHLSSMRNTYVKQFDSIHDGYASMYPEVADRFEPSAMYFGKDSDFQLGGTKTQGGGSDQQSAWDAAAAAIKGNPGKYGGKAPEAVLGPRP